MLVVINNGLGINWHIGRPVPDLTWFNGEIVVAMDPSKKNFAMKIGTPDGHRTLLHVEFSGNNRGRGPIMDTTNYCLELAEYIKALFTGTKLYVVGIEQHILPSGRDGSSAKSYVANTVLTEIRSTVLATFLREFGKKVIEVNNSAWKHAVLPDGYRGKDEKGSKRYYRDFLPNDPINGYFEADMTDCSCIYYYLVLVYCKGYRAVCNAVERRMSEYKYIITPEQYYNVRVSGGAIGCDYAPRFTLLDNLNFYANRFDKEFVMLAPVSSVESSMIYGKVMGFTKDDLYADRVCVVGYY